MVTGLARKVGDTKPPSVKKDQTATNTTKKLNPSIQRARRLTGSSGASPRRRAGALAGVFIADVPGMRLLDETVIERYRQILGSLANHTGFEQDLLGILHESG